MKEIRIRNSNLTFIVDDSDYQKVNQYVWCLNSKNRIYRTGDLIYLVHFLFDDNLQRDHKDRNPFNNQRNNLRLANNSQNGANKEKWLSNVTSKYKGVSYFPQTDKWRVTITVNCKQIHLGYHKLEDKAALVYDQAAKYYFGEFAVLNVVNELREVPVQ